MSEEVGVEGGGMRDGGWGDRGGSWQVGYFCRVGYFCSISCSQQIFFVTLFPTTVETVNVDIAMAILKFYHFGGHFLVGHRHPIPSPSP